MTRFLYMVQVGINNKDVHFFFSYFVNSQLWLNFLMDDCHFGYIAKLKKKILRNTS
jgi:hypothetical protein